MHKSMAPSMSLTHVTMLVDIICMLNCKDGCNLSCVETAHPGRCIGLLGLVGG